MIRFFSLALIFGISLNFLNTRITYADNMSTSDIKDKYVQNQILVKFKDNVTEEDMVQIHRKYGVKSFRKSYGDHYHIVTIRDGEVEKMVNLYSKIPQVKFAEPNYILRAYLAPNDEFFKFQWHLSQINCEKAWDISTGQGVVVAIIDTGVNPNGFDSFGGRIIQGRDFVNGDGDSSDDNGHGTHVAGTVAQATNNGTGVAGVAFDSTILAVKVLGRFGFGNTDAVIDGIRWAADAGGANIINLSLGGPEGSNILEDTINEIHDKGIVIVAAAGNESGSVGFPAAYEKVIAVGSVRFDETLSFFSNSGPEIDVVAPGGDMNIDQNNDGFLDGVLQETFSRGFFRNRNNFDWDFFFFQGTSQASPHVAGVAALILSKNPTFTPDEVLDAITSTAKDLGQPGKDNTFGWGLIDAAAALSPMPAIPSQ